MATNPDYAYYRVGIDPGRASLGIAAIAFDAEDRPMDILTAYSIIHDGNIVSGQSPRSLKDHAGQARRSRNRRRHLRQQRSAIATTLADLGFPPPTEATITATVSALGVQDIWAVRAHLATTPINNPEHLHLALSATVFHMFRHRGYRNSWRSEAVVRDAAKQGFSPAVTQMTDRAHQLAPTVDLPPDPTPAQIVTAVYTQIGHTNARVRALPEYMRAALTKHDRAQERWHNNTADTASSETPPAPELNLDKAAHAARTSDQAAARDLAAFSRHLKQGSLQRSDMVRELHRIGEVQNLPQNLVHTLTGMVITQQSPRPGVDDTVGVDDLPRLAGQPAHRPRAPRSSIAFQQYRIATTVANLRTGNHPLTSSQIQSAFTFLDTWTDTERPTWTDLALHLGVPRLTGTDDQSRPPINLTHRTLASTTGAIRTAWTTPGLSDEHRALLVDLIADVTGIDDVRDTILGPWIDALPDTDLDEIEKTHLESGRAAHCRDNLHRITQHILATGDDLHTTRTTIYQVPDDWRPRLPTLNDPTGNPVVDANIRLINKAVSDLIRRYGKPADVVVEGTRDLALSEQSARELHNRNTKRRRDQDTAVSGLLNPTQQHPARSRQRALLLIEQHHLCLYCGTAITLATMHVDHIVPQVHGGRSTRMNLAAVCEPCNSRKGGSTLTAWAKTADGPSMPAIRDRAKTITPIAVPAGHRARWRRTYLTALAGVETEPPLESFGWAARAIRDRLAHLVGPEHAHLIPGRLTSTVRKIGHIDTHHDPLLHRWPHPLPDTIDTAAKTRLDRRHHALDAAIACLLTDPNVITVLNERNRLRQESALNLGADVRFDRSGARGPWHEYRGTGRKREAFDQLSVNATILRALLADAIAADQIKIIYPKKLTPSLGGIHAETIKALTHAPLGDELTADQVHRASNHALWTALTTHPDYTPGKPIALPANPTRTITVRGRTITAADTITLFGSNGGAIEVRGGWAPAPSIHHGRLYLTARGKLALIKVTQLDAAALQQAHLNPLAAPLQPHMISARQSPAAGLATTPDTPFRIVLPGDHLIIPTTLAQSSTNAAIRKLHDLNLALGHTGPLDLVITGFKDQRVIVRPHRLSSEGADPTWWAATVTANGIAVSPSTLAGSRIHRTSITGQERPEGPRPLDSYTIGTHP